LAAGCGLEFDANGLLTGPPAIATVAGGDSKSDEAGRGASGVVGDEDRRGEPGEEIFRKETEEFGDEG